MLRLLGFFVLVLVVLQLLRLVPVLGVPFRIPLLGFWLSAILVGAGLSKLAADALDRRRQRALERRLGAVDTPHNRGKLGTLLLTQGRAARALPHLEAAAAGESETAEWHYRLGIARLALRRNAEALAAFERAAALDPDHAYGAVWLRLAEAARANGDPERALEVLGRFERERGATPESAFRRGRALRSAGRRGEARAAFAEVPALARGLAAYQRKDAVGWVARAFLARLG